MSQIHNLSVDACLKNTKLIATVNIDDPSPDTIYFFYLFKDGKIIDRIGWQKSNTFEWTVEESGSYFVQGHAKIGDTNEFKKSAPVVYLNIPIRVVGSIGLKRWFKKAGILTSDNNYDITIVDCLGIVEKAIRPGVNKKTIARIVREAVKKVMMKCSGQVYWLFYDFYRTSTLDGDIVWLLEEAYHICRKFNNINVRPYSVVIDESVSIKSVEDFDKYIFNDDFGEIINGIKTDSILSNCIKRPEITLEGNTISVKAKTYKPMPGDLFAFYLFKDRKIVDRVSYSTESTHQWEINETGIYYVCVFLKRFGNTVTNDTTPVFYSDANLKREYREFLSAPAPTGYFQKELPYMSQSEPFASLLCVINRKEDSHGFEDIAGVPFNHKATLGDKTVQIYSEERACIIKDNKRIYFSGNTFQNDRYYFGAKELSTLDAPKLNCNIGNYSAIVLNGNSSVSFYNDIYYIDRWFYYIDDKYTFVSNSYHLLLLAIKKHGIKPELDTDKAKITLSTVTLQFLMQNFTVKMDMKNCYQMPFGKNLIVDSKGCRFVENHLFNMTSSDKAYHELIYKNMTSYCAKKILYNLSTTIKHLPDSRISCDLTGGLDSRCVFAALTLIPDSKEKVKLNSKDVAGSNDLKIAVTLNNLYGYEYNDYEQTIELIPIAKADQYNRSFYLGTYFSKNIVNTKNKSTDRIEINGAFGEAIIRPYTSRKLLEYPVFNCTDTAEFAGYVYDFYSSCYVLSSDITRDCFVNYLSEELNNFPGSTILEKYEYLYLTYRHGYHFGSISDRFGITHIMPLQIPEYCEAFHYSYNVHRSIRMQLELIETWNPDLYSVPFDDDSDNIDADRLLKTDCRCNKLPISDDISQWEKAEKVRKANLKYISDDNDNSEPVIHHIETGLIRNFHILMNLCPELRDTLGIELYHKFLNPEKNTREFTYWYNKITSLMDQVLIFLQDEDDTL